MKKASLALFTSISIIFSFNAFALETKAPHAILVDYDTDTVIFEKEADVPTVPSSMSKLMTVYVIFDKLKKGELKLNERFLVSENAWRKQGSKMFLHVGSSVTLEDLIKGIIIQSGNDACITAAEGIAGTEEEFVNILNEKAKELGLTNSHFVNSTGWPDDNHKMSMRDLSILSKHLINDFPEYYSYFAEREFVYNNIKQQNRNLSLNRFNGVDGLKTGHTDAGGYGIAMSAQQKNRRLIVVVNGLSSMKERAEEAERLLSHGFISYDNVHLVKKDVTISSIPVWLGDKNSIECYSKEDLVATLPKSDMSRVYITIRHLEKIPAPIAKDSHIANLVIDVPGSSAKTYKLYAKEDVSSLGMIQRAIFKIKHKFSL